MRLAPAHGDDGASEIVAARHLFTALVARSLTNASKGF
jgi:hypothetical protein